MMDGSSQRLEGSSKSTKWIRLLNPAIPKRWLLLLAGLMWTGVGVLLSSLAVIWLMKSLSTVSILLGILGVAISIAANRFQFTRLALKNISRILTANDRVCLFSFQAWTGYLIIAVMMSTGIFLRNSAIPKPYLAAVYIGIGGALLQASFNYYRHFFQSVKTNDR